MNKAGKRLPVVLLVGALDTKGLLLDYLKSVLESNGLVAKIMDVGFKGSPETVADISREEVAAKQNQTPEAVSCDVCVGIDTMSEGARVLATDLLSEGEIDAIIGVGGCLGTIINCNIMKSMPIGFPKLIISTIPYDIRTSLGSSDIMFLYSVADVLGLNPITRTVLEKSAGAIIGMIKTQSYISEEPKKRNIGVSALGITTQAAEFIYKKLADKGFEVTVFHANGVGGSGFEAAAMNGMFDGIIDLTTHEINNILFETPAIRDVNRMDNVTAAGVPYIFVPGGLDVITQGPVENLSEEYSLRPYYRHSKAFTHVRVNEDEAAQIATFVSEKLNKATSTVGVCIPMNGFSERNREGSKIFNKNVDNTFVKILKENIRKDIVLEEISVHINDEKFADSVCSMMMTLLENNKK